MTGARGQFARDAIHLELDGVATALAIPRTFRALTAGLCSHFQDGGSQQLRPVPSVIIDNDEMIFIIL